MPIVILKTNGGMDFPTPKGVVSLNGFCTINQVSDDEIKGLKSFEPFNEMVKNGFIEISNKATTEDANKLASEVVKEQVAKQSSRTKNIKKEV